MERINLFVAHLNNICFILMISCKFHYFVFENGNFYKKHPEQFNDNFNRQFSMICNLNNNWETGNKGESIINQTVDSQ